MDRVGAKAETLRHHCDALPALQSGLRKASAYAEEHLRRRLGTGKLKELGAVQGW